jgi:hypothetical protein
MKLRPLLLSSAFALALVVPVAAQKGADVKPKDPIKTPTVELYGSLDNSELATLAPPIGVIVTAKGWQQLSEAWVIKNPAKVDFNKEFLVVATSRAGKMVLNVKRTDDGDLRTEVLENADLQGGFRYAIRSVSRDGVKTVNGKPLPVE